MSFKQVENTYRYDSTLVLYEYRLPDLAIIGYDNASIFIEYNSVTQIMKEFLRFGLKSEMLLIGASSVSEQNLFQLIDGLLDLDFLSVLTCYHQTTEYDSYKPS